MQTFTFSANEENMESKVNWIASQLKVKVGAGEAGIIYKKKITS